MGYLKSTEINPIASTINDFNKSFNIDFSTFTTQLSESKYAQNISIFPAINNQLFFNGVNNFSWNFAQPNTINFFNSSFNVLPNFDSFNIQLPKFEPNFSIDFGSYPIGAYYSSAVTGDKKGRKPSGNDYADLTREQAIAKAKKDPNLEELRTTTSPKGHKVIISDASFVNDIPFAKKGTMKILLETVDKIGRDITVTSALGTLNSPHSGANDNTGHYDPLNPKLDFGGGLSKSEAEALKRDLASTGFYSSINVESDGKSSHLDIKLA